MRVMFTSSQWAAHYYPMAPLGWALSAAGHDVRVTCAPSFAPVVTGSGLTAVPVAADMDLIRMARYGACFGFGHPPGGGGIPLLHPETGKEMPPGATLDAKEAKAKWVLPQFGALRQGIDGVVAWARGWRPDLVVSDLACCEGVVAARALGIPALWNLWGPVGPVESEPGLDFFRDFLPGEFARQGMPTDGPVAAGAIDPCPEVMSPRAGGVRLRVRCVPYNGPAAVPGWLSDRPRRRRVCVTWGTSITPIFGRRSFLVPAILRALADEDVEVVAAVDTTNRELLGELPPNVRFAGRVPLGPLLATCSAIIHSGGAGSVMTSLAAGVPQLSLTFAPEQDAEGRRLAATGAGRHLLGRESGMDDIRSAIGAILHEPSYRATAGRLRAENLARPAPQALVPLLDELAGTTPVTSTTRGEEAAVWAS
jgi:Erythromycin biosynthesis protein CIII-like, C-terminal domain/Erythromycin biosynthesis protein CIII-like, N-terminal domain